MYKNHHVFISSKIQIFKYQVQIYDVDVVNNKYI